MNIVVPPGSPDAAIVPLPEFLHRPGSAALVAFLAWCLRHAVAERKLDLAAGCVRCSVAPGGLPKAKTGSCRFVWRRAWRSGALAAAQAKTGEPRPSRAKLVVRARRCSFHLAGDHDAVQVDAGEATLVSAPNWKRMSTVVPVNADRSNWARPLWLLEESKPAGWRSLPEAA